MNLGTPATPLAQQLGLKPGIRCWFHHMPDAVRAAIDPDRAQVEEQPTPSDGLQCAHLFVADQDQLLRELTALQPLMASNGFVWAWWHADGAVGEAEVRAIASARGLNDSQASDAGEGWSGLKLSLCKTLR